MAQAQYDKFVELRKSGVDAKEARLQAYGETPVASVAPVTPAVPTTPAPVSTPQVPTSSEVIQGVKDLGGDVQNRQNTRNVMTGKGGTVTPSGAILNADGSVTPAPIETSSAPVTPAPTPTTPVETPAPIDKNAEIKAKNEAQMALNKQKSELAIADRKRQAEEVKLASIPTDQKGVLNALISGASVPTQNTQAYRNAKVQYDTFKKFNSMTPTQLLDNLKMNEIGTDMDQLLASNPNYVQAKQKLNEIQKVTNLNKTMSNIVAGANGTEIKAVTPEQNEIDISTKLMQKFGLDDANAEAFSQFIATDEEMADNKAKLLANRNQLSNVNRQINETTTLLNQGIKDIKAQYPDMSASGIITLMGSRLSEFNDTITNLNSTKSLLDADIKMEMDLAKSAFDAKSADIQAQNQIRSAMAIGDYNASLDLQKNQAEFDQKIAQQAQAMNDPVMAISSMIDEYKKLGIPFTRSTQQVIADFQSSGQDLPTYLSNLQKTIQSKPEYQKIQALQQGQMSDAQKIASSQNFEMKKMGIEQDFQMALAQANNVTNNKWTKLDDGLYTNENGEIMTSDELKTAKLIGNTYLQKQVGEEGGDCGFYASRGTGMSSTPGGNSKEARTKAFSETTPQVGGMAFFGGAGYDPTYGHISIVTGVNADGTINIKDSNYNNDGKVTERTVPANTATGFYNNTPLAQGVSQPTGAQGEYTDQNINDLAYLVGLQEKNPTQAAKDMKELGYTARDLANYKAGNVPLTENQKNSSMDIMNAIKDLSDSSKYEWNDAVGKFDPSRIIGTQDAEDATMAINNLVAKLTLPNLGVLKGPMSDKDIQFIKEASSKLATTQSNDSFERNLIDAYNLAARRAGQPEIKKLSDLSAGTSSVGGEADYSKYE